MASGYTKYYLQQGSGLSDIGNLHHQPVFVQRGSGFGGLFTKLYKYLAPLANSGLSALKQQAIQSGKDILQDISTQKSFKEILKERGREAVNDLTLKGIDKLKKAVNKQRGSGYIKRRTLMNSSILPNSSNSRRRHRRRRRAQPLKRKRVTKIKQIGGRRRRRRTTKKRQKHTRTLDIFN